MAGEGLHRMGAELIHRFAHDLVMDAQVEARLPTAILRSQTSLAASILNSRLNFCPCVTHLRLYETPNLDVHQTGSSSISHQKRKKPPTKAA